MKIINSILDIIDSYELIILDIFGVQEQQVNGGKMQEYHYLLIVQQVDLRYVIVG